MKVKTIKLSNERLENGKFKEYTTIYEDGILDEHDCILLNGAREAGKSYPVAKYFSDKLKSNKSSKFIYMRNRNVELATFEGWFSDLDLIGIAREEEGDIAYTKLIRGKPVRGDVTLKGYTEDGDEVYERVIAKCVSLESASEFKSGKYTEYFGIVFEEYVYLDLVERAEKKYVFNFLDNVASIFRGRPKKVICICNSLKSIPLLERAIDEVSQWDNESLFVNPIKIKIFRKGNKKPNNDFMAYLGGELYVDDDFEVRLNEFFEVYVDKNFVVKRHKVHRRKYYVSENKSGKQGEYKVNMYMKMLNMLEHASANEYYYQSKKVEIDFNENYQEFIKGLESFLSYNVKYIDNTIAY